MFSTGGRGHSLIDTHSRHAPLPCVIHTLIDALATEPDTLPAMNLNTHRARISHNGKRYNVGQYPTKHDAQVAQLAALSLLARLTPEDVGTSAKPKPQIPDAKTLIKYITQGRYDNATQAIHHHVSNRHRLIQEMKATRKWVDQSWTTVA